MNRNQKLVLATYCLVMLAMSLYVPFTLTVQGNVVMSEYSFIWEPIHHKTRSGLWFVGKIDALRLLFQYIGATLISAAMTLFFSINHKASVK